LIFVIFSNTKSDVFVVRQTSISFFLNTQKYIDFNVQIYFFFLEHSPSHTGKGGRSLSPDLILSALQRFAPCWYLLFLDLLQCMPLRRPDSIQEDAGS